MNSEQVVLVEGVYKKFCRSLRHSMVYSVEDLFREGFNLHDRRASLRQYEFWALDDINFEIKRGETLGVIGRNGAGKSTLLRLINGIYPPDKGRIQIRGRVAALIAIGAGFHPQFSGKENIFINGTLLGMTRRDIKARLDEIIAFADIAEFIDAPVYTYSSGMKVRLGFAVASHAPIEVLLADEVLAVGDNAFKIKCWNKIGGLRAQGISTLFVTHDMASVPIWCHRAMLMHKGKVKFFGAVDECIEIYLRDFMEEMGGMGVIERQQTGTDEFIISNVRFNPEMENNKILLPQGEDLTVIIDYEARRDFLDILINTSIFIPIPISVPFFQAANNSINNTSTALGGFFGVTAGGNIQNTAVD
jgi:lipopolysaccharide transport system ATP-binding protein